MNPVDEPLGDAFASPLKSESHLSQSLQLDVIMRVSP